MPDDAPVFVGGPVDQHSVLVVAEFEDPEDSASTIFEDVGFVRGDTDIDLAAEATRRARVFAGYTGWSAGQLDAELEADGWIVVSAEREDVFGDEDEECGAPCFGDRGDATSRCSRRCRWTLAELASSPGGARRGHDRGRSASL